MPNNVTPVVERDLFVLSEARQETLLRNTYARQAQQQLTTAPALNEKPPSVERSMIAKR